MINHIEVVWFKRDLRTFDHQPLFESALSGNPVLPLYVVEPEMWCQADSAVRHWQFIADSLLALNEQLTMLGQPLIIMHGDVIEVFKQLSKAFDIKVVRSHQETGNDWSFNRDTQLKSFLQAEHIEWVESLQYPVKRGVLDRDHYYRFSRGFFDQPVWKPPHSLTGHIDFKDFDVGIRNPFLQFAYRHHNENIQPGGRPNGQILLKRFLAKGFHKYLAAVSKPKLSRTHSSRLSPHLAYGTLSIREVVQATTEVAQQHSANKSLRAFADRLFWQSHFIQKLETEPEMQFHSLHPFYQTIRPWQVFSQYRHQCWLSGKTGFPIIDACMRCLNHTGWLPFRMRALVTSFATYQLWIPWQTVAVSLARLFTDYEPGIHYSQVQMQSGVTGINQMRVYNPVKQSKDHDGEGQFIRQWCPELRGLPESFVHEPWLLDEKAQTSHGVMLGVDYPYPVIDLIQATRFAKQAIAAITKEEGYEAISRAIYLKHGSRKRKRPTASARKPPQKKVADAVNAAQQLVLF